MSILEDLTSLSPRKLEKRLEQLAKDALPCIDVWVADGNREHGLTVALHVDARSRRDVQDLARVLSEEPRGLISTAWTLAPPAKRLNVWRLALLVDVERPVELQFAIRFDVTTHPGDPMRKVLPLLLAASWLLLVTDDNAEPGEPEVCFAAPLARDCLIDILSSPV